MGEKIEQTVSANLQTRTVFKELFRKLLHMSIAFVPLIIEISSRIVVLILLALGSCVYLISEYIRTSTYKKRNNPLRLISESALFASRPGEAERIILAPVTLAIGTALILLFPLAPLSCGIYVLAFGDTAASLVGQYIKSAKIPWTRGKSITGFCACYAISTVCVCTVVKDPGIALLAGGGAAILELFSRKDIDNILLPLGTAFLVWLLL